MSKGYPKIIHTRMLRSDRYDRVDSLAEEIQIRAGNAKQAEEQAREESEMWGFVHSEIERVTAEQEETATDAKAGLAWAGQASFEAEIESVTNAINGRRWAMVRLDGRSSARAGGQWESHRSDSRHENGGSMRGKLVEFIGTISWVAVRQDEGQPEENVAAVTVRDFDSNNEKHVASMVVPNKQAGFKAGQKVVVTIEAADE